MTSSPPTMDPGANTPAAVRAAVAVAGPAAARGEVVTPPPPPENVRRERELQEKYTGIRDRYGGSKYLSRARKSELQPTAAPETPVSDADGIVIRSRDQQNREMLDQNVIQQEQRVWDEWYASEEIRAADLPQQLQAEIQEAAWMEYINSVYQAEGARIQEEQARRAEAERYGYSSYEALQQAIWEEKAIKRLNDLGNEMADLGQLAKQDFGEYYRETGRDLSADLIQKANQVEQLESHIVSTFGVQKSPEITAYLGEVRKAAPDIRTQWAAAEGLNNTLNRLANEYWSAPPRPGSAYPDLADAPLLPAGLTDQARAAGYTGSSLKEFENWQHQYTSDVIAAKTERAAQPELRLVKAGAPITATEPPPSSVSHPTESMSTYGFYEDMAGRADWWRENIANPFAEQITPIAKHLGLDIQAGIATGLVNSPAIVAEFVGMIPPGAERLSKTPENISEYVWGGLELQGQSIYEGITQRPAEFAGELLGLALIARGVRGGLGKAPGYARTVGKEYIPIEKIGYDVQHGYPLGKTTPAGLQKSFVEGTLSPRPDMMASGRTADVPYVPQSARLPTDPAGSFQMWTAWDRRIKPDVPFGKSVTLGSGPSEIPGMYGAPVALSYFTKAGGGMVPKLFGLDLPSWKSPSILRTQVSEFEAIPRHLSRETIGLKTQGASNEAAYASINRFLAANKEPGKAYFPMTKAEYEAVLPEGNVLEILGSRYYTKVGGIGRSHVGGTRVPIYELRATGSINPEYQSLQSLAGPKKKISHEYGRPSPYISVSNLALASLGITMARRGSNGRDELPNSVLNSRFAPERDPRRVNRLLDEPYAGSRYEKPSYSSEQLFGTSIFKAYGGLNSTKSSYETVKPSYEATPYSTRQLFSPSAYKLYGYSPRTAPRLAWQIPRSPPPRHTPPPKRPNFIPPPPPPPRRLPGRTPDPRRQRKRSRRAWTGMDVFAPVLSGFEALTGRPERLKIPNRRYPLTIEIDGKITQRLQRPKKQRRGWRI